MSILTFINARGEAITFSTMDMRYQLVGLPDVGGTASDIQTSKAPYQDGTSYIDSLLGPKDIPVEVILSASDQNELERMKMRVNRVFNPKLGPGTLRYEKNGEVKEIKGTSEGTPAFPTGNGNRFPGFQRVTVDMYCPDPYWKDSNQVSKALQSYVGNFSLPFSLPFELGISGDYTILNNAGDVPAPVVIDISGPTTNPKITNTTTGEFIRINRSIAANEIVQIDTSPNHKRVEIIRDGQSIANGFGYLDHASKLFKLVAGDNQIEYIADAGDADAIVAIAWQNRYAGI